MEQTKEKREQHDDVEDLFFPASGPDEIPHQ
jgi:hypothetical protein